MDTSIQSTPKRLKRAGSQLDTDDMDRWKVELRVHLNREKRRFAIAKMADTFDEVLIGKLQENHVETFELYQENFVRLKYLNKQSFARLEQFLNLSLDACHSESTIMNMQRILKQVLDKANRKLRNCTEDTNSIDDNNDKRLPNEPSQSNHDNLNRTSGNLLDDITITPIANSSLIENTPSSVGDNNDDNDNNTTADVRSPTDSNSSEVSIFLDPDQDAGGITREELRDALKDIKLSGRKSQVDRLEEKRRQSQMSNSANFNESFMFPYVEMDESQYW